MKKTGIAHEMLHLNASRSLLLERSIKIHGVSRWVFGLGEPFAAINFALAADLWLRPFSPWPLAPWLRARFDLVPNKQKVAALLL